MTPLRDILSQAQPIEAGFSATVPSDWMQGRTSYGGLSSALALHAAQALEPDLPPLRSAQISFIGPLAGAVSVTATKLRRGRNAAFVQADVSSEAGLGLRATFIFMTAIESKVTHDAAPRAPRTPPPTDASLHIGPDHFFTGNFEYFDDKSALEPAEWLRWVRLRDRAGVDPMVEMMAIGDALPPAAFRLFDAPVPISSLSWIMNVLTPVPSTDDGWWLLHARADRAVDGYSSQRMTIWNAAGEPVADAMQGVAIFG